MALARSLNDLAWLYYDMANFSKAEPLFKRVLEIAKKLRGEHHPDVAQCQKNLGVLYEGMGNYDNAWKYYSAASLTLRVTVGRNHRDYADIEESLGKLYMKMDLYFMAEGYLNNALTIRKNILDNGHPKIAQSLYYLAELYTIKGDYSRAETFYRKALEIYEGSNESAQPSKAIILVKLGRIYKILGNYYRAETLYLEALSILEQSGNPMYLVSAKRSLGRLYLDSGDDSQAEQFLREAFDIIPKRSSYDSMKMMLLVLDDLGWLFYKRKDYSQAKTLFKASLDIKKNIFGDYSLDIAKSLYYIALVHQAKGHYSHAEKIYNQVLTIIEKKRDPFHESVTNPLEQIALLKLTKGKWKKALPLMERAFPIIMNSAYSFSAFSSERQKLIHRNQISKHMDLFLSIALAGKDDRIVVRKGYDAVVKTKGYVLEALIAETDATNVSSDPDYKRMQNELIDVREQITAIAFNSAGGDPSTYIFRMKSLQKKKEELEANIARKSFENRVDFDRIKAEFHEVCMAIPDGSALIDYVQFNRYEPSKNPDEHKWTPWMIAFVYDSGFCGQPELIDLGPLEPIQEAVKTWRKVLEASSKSGQKYSLMRSGKDLADLVWYKVAAAIPMSVEEMFAPTSETRPAKGRTIYISPDGPLHLVPFAALPNHDGSYLIESYDLGYATTAKGFLPKPAPHSRQEKIYLLGAPDFDQSIINTHEDCSGKMLFSGADLVKLDSSEVISIQKKLNDGGKYPEVVTDADATESSFKRAAKNASILHLATHGFFSQGKKHGRQRTGLGSFNSAPVFMDNPLLLSGLALAGVKNSCRRDDGDDGVLFALEVANLDLRGVKLVVLSACNTGMGEVITGEGVFGLKSSFIIAGAEGLVVSLWSVRDDSTRNLMVSFYDKMFSEQALPPQQALRSAQIETIEEARQGEYSDHPYHWAAFQYVK